MLDLSRLSPEQRAVVLAADGPLQVVAGPGSGKTTVLAARIAYLVAARRVPPASILALTFARKAGQELRGRLGDLLGPQAGAVDVSTFHAWGLRVVHAWAEELGFGPVPLSVYNPDEACAVLGEVAHDLSIGRDGAPLDELLADLERFRLGQTIPGQKGELLPALAECYERTLRRRGAIDYAGMLVLPLRLFDRLPSVLRLCQDAYRHLLVDEFQDACGAQYALLTRLAMLHRSLLVVGDPMQTIYGWRGADVELLRNFRRDFPEARVMHLAQSFRSTRSIIALANRLGEQLSYSQVLWTGNPAGERPHFHLARDEWAEAGFVAAEIERLLGEGTVERPGEIAVLYRTNRQAHELTLALRKRGVPYQVRGHGDLFARREVRDALCYLRLAHNPADAVALSRIVNVPPRRLGRLAEDLGNRPATLEVLPDLARAYGEAAMVSAQELIALVRELHGRNGQGDPASLLDVALERSGYRAWLAAQSDGPLRLGHLARLRELLARTGGDLGSWLTALQLGDEPAPVPDERERVLLSTIHGAKGAEWRVVFVTGFEEGLLPHARSLAPDAPRGSLEEEQRLAYVAVTRAQERLYFTACHSRWDEPRRPSRFLRGLPLERSTRAA